ncbi:MAG: hypothetical protein AAFN93_22805 [Bacteroidota bacterium]
MNPLFAEFQPHKFFENFTTFRRMLARNILIGLFLVANYLARADTYLYVHRSSSSFETRYPISIKVNYSDITTIRPGEWKLVVITGRTQSLVVNLAFPEGVKDDQVDPCSFPRKLIPSASDSIHFLTVGDEFCNMRTVPRQRSLAAIEGGGLIKGYRLTGKTVTDLEEDLVNQLTKQLVGVSLTEKGADLSDLDIDSLKALALEALELRKKLAEKEAAMKEQLQDYFELMKALNKLDQNVQPLVHVGMEEGEVRGNRVSYNVRATFSYDILDEGVKAELVHYPSGDYLLEKSAAAFATAISMKNSIRNYMAEYFEQGSTVKIRIIGSADAQKIGRPIPYRGEYASVKDQEFYITDDYQIIISEKPKIDSTVIDKQSGRELMTSVARKPEPLKKGLKRTITFDTKTMIAENEMLAYLRSHGIRDYIMNEIPSMNRTRNEFLHQVKIEQGVGGRFRKVVIELLIEDVLRSK